jgi:hypothetical protein
VKNAALQSEDSSRRRVERLDYDGAAFSLYCGATESRFSHPVKRLVLAEVDAIDVEIRIDGEEAGAVERWEAVYGSPKVYY